MYKKVLFIFVTALFLGVAYYGISPLFKNTVLDEPTPEKSQMKKDEVGVNPKSTSTSSNVEEESIAIVVHKNNAVKETEKSSSIQSTPGHPASGIVKVIRTENSKILRYENFKTINGPDLYVYLSKDLEAKDFVNLGKLKATEGNINYEVPLNTNLEDYRYVMIWCKAFGVLFNYALIPHSSE